MRVRNKIPSPLQVKAVHGIHCVSARRRRLHISPLFTLHRLVSREYRLRRSATVLASNPKDASTAAATQEIKYQVLRHLLEGLLSTGQLESKLPLLAASQPDVTSVGFMQWLATQERKCAPSSPEKETLGALCALLVGVRETAEAQQLEEQHRIIMAGVQARLPVSASHSDSSSEEEVEGQQQLALTEMMSRHPTRVAMQVAEVVTGVPVRPELYEPKYEAGLRLSPPMSLTQAGVQKGMEQAEILAADIKARKKRTLAAFMGRAQLKQQEVVQVLGGTPASRILDVLLSMPDHAQRAAALPDAFTPPDTEEDVGEEPVMGESSDTQFNAASQKRTDQIQSQTASTSETGSRRNDGSSRDEPVQGFAVGGNAAGTDSFSASSEGIFEAEVVVPRGDSGSVPFRESAGGSAQDADADSGPDTGRGAVGDEAAGTSRGDGDGGEEEEDLLWCTPMQLLSEIARRMQATAGPVAGQLPGSVGGLYQPQMLPSPNLESGEQLTDALQLLRQEIMDNWLKQLP